MRNTRHAGSKPVPSFDRIARLYRWLEYGSFGRALERCRLTFLPQLLETRRALVLGEGDGRFLARLLPRNPTLHAEAVDLSPAMLRLTLDRAAGSARRLVVHHADARTFQPTGTYDLIVTHFFLDCLTEPELDRLTFRLLPHLTPDALWLLSDFRIPPGALRLPARILVRLLYLAFRLLTGLRTTRLPDHARSLEHACFRRLRQHVSLAGILTAELWQRHPSGSSRHPTSITSPKELPMATSFPAPPSPVPALPPTPGTDLPSGPASDPIPDPEPPSPSVSDLGIPETTV